MAWVPLESNPEVMTKFLHKLGVPKKWSIVDVYGLDVDLLAIIPKPVFAVILLHPIPRSERTEGEKGEAKETKELIIQGSKKEPMAPVYHIKQCVPNACGTIALIHCIANNLDAIQLEDGFLSKFLDETKDLSFAERGERLINAQSIIDTHMESAQEGQTEAPSEDTDIYHHFIAFIQKNNVLYELDGRKPYPVSHGYTIPETVLEDAAAVCQKYIDRDPEEVRFTVVALIEQDNC